MNDQVQQLILSKLDVIDEKLDRYSERLTTVETQMKPIIDNGQKGSLTKLHDRVSRLEEFRWKMAGYGSVLFIAIQLLIHALWLAVTGK